MEPHTKHFELVEQCKDGDRRAQFKLYQAYNKAMFNICFRMMGDREAAEDVLQNAFVDIFGKLDTFRFEASVRSWI
ncbi:MAG: RNA polymerase, partial [Saprospiraceae bacterium]|nr:RNA polymerase [Saprospiraceae bacterium]